MLNHLRIRINTLICAIVLAVLSAIPAHAVVSISISSPTASQSISGYTGFSFTSAITSGPNVALVCYVVDAFSAVQTDNGGLPLTGCANASTNFALAYNTFNLWNGSHSVVATAYDALGNTAATSSAVAFTVANTWPVLCAPILTVTPPGSWTGIVSISASITGTCGVDKKTLTLTVDGQTIISDTLETGTSFTYSLDTTKFNNAVHVPALSVFYPAGTTVTDLATTNGTSTSCTVTSASHSFVANDVNRSLQILAGTNWTFISRLNIASVSVGAATLNGACGTASTLTAGTATIGGGAVYYGIAGGTTATANNPLEVGNTLEWSASATFSNSATPMETWAGPGGYEIHVAPSATFQLSPVLVNTDLTTVSSPTFNYFSENTGVATVSNTGLVTGQTVTGANPSSAQIDITAIAPAGGAIVVNATDLHCVATCATNTAGFSSASHAFTPQTLGQNLIITAANGWTAGTYKITTASTNGNVFLSLCTNGNCVSCAPANGNNPAAGATGNGTFSTGPTRTAWAFSNSTNAIYHFGSDGSILSSYNPLLSLFTSSGFQSSTLLPATSAAAGGTDQPYSPGFTADWNSLGFKTLETGCPAYPNYAGGPLAGQTAWQASITSSVSAFNTAVSPYNFKGILTCDSWERTGQAIFDTTRGLPYSNWTPQAPLTYLFSSFAGTAIAVEMQDEVTSAWNSNPLVAPATFANGGVTSITASAGVCTINGGTVAINGGNHFVISGSAITGMNSANPATSALSSTGPYKFPCAGVPNGTYGAGGTADAGLQLWPFATAWLNNTTGTTTSPNDFTQGAFVQYKTWINAAGAGRPNATWAVAGGTNNCGAIYNWNNTAAGLADYATLYYIGYGSPYLGSRANVTALISSQGNVYRSLYGCFSPNLPVLHQASAVPNNYGFQGPSFTVTSFSGNTVTFSAPHGVYNITPGVTRIYLTNMSTSADNGNYYILSAPTATTLTVSNSKTDFVASKAGISGGTLTFSNGDMYSLIASGGVEATGTNSCSADGGTGIGSVCGDAFALIGGVNSTVAKHRGQTFILTGVSGTGSAPFNSRTFVYSPENIPAPTGSFARFRQIPVGSSSSGTGTILQDNNMVLGRNAVTQQMVDPATTFINVWYTAALNGAGYRLYNSTPNQQAYNPTGGYSNSSFISSSTTFFDTASYDVQLYIGPHWENYYSVPNAHAAGAANLLINRIAPYLLTASLNSPDYGRAFETTARSGTAGKSLVALNMTTAAQSRTFDLTPYLQSGQNIIRFIQTYNSLTLSTIAAGTTSDPNVSVPYGGVVVYLFPVNFAAELIQPTISSHLADVANAVKIVARYGYDQYTLDAGNTVVDCGNGTSCQLPVDRNIGPVYYRLLFLNSSNAVLATSDVGTM